MEVHRESQRLFNAKDAKGAKERRGSQRSGDRGIESQARGLTREGLERVEIPPPCGRRNDKGMRRTLPVGKGAAPVILCATERHG